MTATPAPDLVVVGGGVMGAWTALRAAEGGRRTLLLDALGPGDPRATSTDVSRISRASHGPDELYARWSREAREDWIALGEETGEELFVQCGSCWLAHRDGGFETESLATLVRLGIPVERFGAAEAARRWPALAPDSVAFVVHEPEAGAVRARAGVLAAVTAFERRRGQVRVERVRPGRVEGNRLVDVVAASGERYAGGAFVFAAGPWLPTLFPGLLGGLIRITKQDVLYLAPEPGDRRFDPDRFTAWVDYDEAVYGLPAIDGHGPKAGLDTYGPVFDPDTGDRVVDAASIERTRSYLARAFPDLARRPVLEARVCQYEATPDANFVIDRHPELDNAWLVGGGSGHGFKQGPRIARQVMAMLDGAPEPDDGRFAISSPRTARIGLRSGATLVPAPIR